MASEFEWNPLTVLPPSLASPEGYAALMESHPELNTLNIPNPVPYDAQTNPMASEFEMNPLTVLPPSLASPEGYAALMESHPELNTLNVPNPVLYDVQTNPTVSEFEMNPLTVLPPSLASPEGYTALMESHPELNTPNIPNPAPCDAQTSPRVSESEIQPITSRKSFEPRRQKLRLALTSNHGRHRDGQRGDTNPHPLDASTNPLEPQIPSFTNPIQFTQDDSDSEDGQHTAPSGTWSSSDCNDQIQKVRTLEHNDTDPSGWKQALAYQLIPYALEWLLDSNIPRPHKSHTSFGRWKYWSRLVASWMYNQIDVTLQNKLRNLSKMPKYADQLYDELMSMTQGSDRMQTAFIEMRKFDKMKRSDYNSASEYIEEYQRQYHVLARFKAAPHPSHGLSQVLQNIELEVMKVEEYWRALQAAADMEGVANATYNNNAGRGRGNGRGGRGGNRGGRGGQNNNGHNDDNTQSNKDTNAVEDDTATAKKKKKKGLRKQPADGKDIHEYANEMRNGTQKDDNNMCSFCGFGPHTAKRCAYLSIWRMDGGTEFKEFIKWGEKHGMTFEITPPYTAEPNGTVERFGGHINDIQRTMIIDAKMTEEMWPYATDTAIYIYNRLINPKTKISPLTHWRQELEIPNAEPSLKHLKPWGTTAYVHIPKPKRIQARKQHPEHGKESSKLVVSRDVGFPQPGDDDNDDTGSMLVNGVPTDPKDPDGDNDVVGFMPVSLTQDDEISKPEIKQRQMAPVTPSTIHLPTIYGSASTMPETPQKTIVPPMRQRKLFQKNVPDVIKQKKEDLGRRLQQLSTQVSQLAESMDDVRRDADNIERSANPATPAPPPPRRSRRANIGIAPDRYHDPEQKHLAVEYEKRDRDIQRTAKRAKAKESGGNNLTEGDGQAEMSKVDIDEPFLYNGKPLYAKDVDLPSTYKQAQKSPFWPQWLDAMQRQLGDLVAKNTWSLILKPPKAKILPGQWRFTVKSNTRDEVYEFKARWVVCGNFQDKNDGKHMPLWRQVDFTAAYLNASREDVETVYMRQPTGFEYADAEGDKNQWVCTLNQALFGLRDSAFLWNEEMDCKLRQIGFHPLDDDPCVYVKGKGTELTIMMIHVDDFIIAAPTDEDIEKVVNELRQYYDLKDLGEPKQYLNCALHRDYDNCTITMSQEAYIQKPHGESPANASNVLDDDSFDQYQSVVGMLNWLAVKTRPDIRFAVTRLQHRLANPTFEDLHAMQHVVKYLRHMPDVGITLGRTQELRFYAHVDASHADWEDSKSTEGSIWYFAGSPVIWTTKKQTITANSTTVAEWCALDQPTRDAMWLGKIARSFMLPEQRPIEIHTDNINSQLLLTKKGGKSANRWLDLRWFFVKDAVAQGHVDIRRVDTKKNAADGFTKALAKEQFEAFVGKYGEAHIKRAYGDWTNPQLKGWSDVLPRNSIQPIQQISYTHGKNATDSAMIIDAMDLLTSNHFDGFCLVSSDSDFTPLVTRIRDSGLKVYGFGEHKTPKAFVSACDEFIFTEDLNHRSGRKISPNGVAMSESHDPVHNASDSLLQNSAEMTLHSGEWARVSDVREHLMTRHPDFSLSTRGYAKLSDLISDSPQFDIEERPSQRDKSPELFVRHRRISAGTMKV
ncbi:hypothetical protein PDIDSM_4687 [Penicillium digitatum]|nr:hypothetical protein PDIDSM_4687 [Penicillium digitatum]